MSRPVLEGGRDSSACELNGRLIVELDIVGGIELATWVRKGIDVFDGGASGGASCKAESECGEHMMVLMRSYSPER